MSYRPVYNPINDVVRNTLEAKRVELEKERLEQEKELRLAELKQNKELTSRQLDLADAQHELTKTIQEQAIEKQYHIDATLPAGSTETRGVTGVQGDPTTGFSLKGIGPNGMDENQVQLNIPHMGIFNTQTPEAASARAGQLGLLREKPLLEKQAQQQKEIQDRELALESARALSAQALKRIEEESADKRSEAANAARAAIADKNNQARIKAAEIGADKLTSAQKTSFENLKDMEDAIKAAQASLGDFNSKDSNWYKYYTNSGKDELVRNNPNAGMLLSASPFDTNAAAALKVLDTTLLDKGKYNTGIQKILATGLTSQRNQTPTGAKNNLDILLHQIQQEKINIGSAGKKDPLGLFN